MKSYQTNLEDVRQQENDSHKFMLLNEKYFEDKTEKLLASISVRKKDISFSDLEGKVYKNSSPYSGAPHQYYHTQENDNKVKLHKTDSISEYYIRLPLDFTNPKTKNATLKIDFYQQCYSNQYVYILESTNSWSTSLNKATFTVSLDDNYDLKSNYKDFVNKYELADGRKKYICELSPLFSFPSSDLLISWK
ncbi:hypothetical protein JEZ13_09345 [bacterium]|nr:hypothetical protein [bacterium]